jgi:hypothetical protein
MCRPGGSTRCGKSRPTWTGEGLAMTLACVACCGVISANHLQVGGGRQFSCRTDLILGHGNNIALLIADDTLLSSNSWARAANELLSRHVVQLQALAPCISWSPLKCQVNWDDAESSLPGSLLSGRPNTLYFCQVKHAIQNCLQACM